MTNDNLKTYSPKEDLLSDWALSSGVATTVCSFIYLTRTLGYSELNDIISNVLYVCLLLSLAICLSCYVLRLYLIKRSSAPRKYLIENDLHELLATQGLIDSTDPEWAQKINLSIKRGKHSATCAFRVRNPKATVTFFQSLHIPESGSFDGCTVDYVEKQGSNIVWELVFTELEECYV